MQNNAKPEWLKNRGYLHISPKRNLLEEEVALISKIHNPNYIAKHAFFPLIHSIIKERKYKKIKGEEGKRAHSYRDENGVVKKNTKCRPLHYATHIDAMIFSCYAEKLLNAYEYTLRNFPIVAESVIAYRKIKLAGSDKNKSTIHFAYEVFEEIKKRAKNGNCCVLKFDIKSFFSNLDHTILKRTWARVINEPNLPADHYNVFKAATKFSYIMKDDLRVTEYRGGKRSCFDEKKIAYHTKNGVQSFFESPKEFRDKLNSKEISLHRFPFKNKEGKPVGIPQGLPISAILANIYLLDFDISVVEKVVLKYGAYYKRYSDDIIVVCQPQNTEEILCSIKELIEQSKVEISFEKTEKFCFEMHIGKGNEYRLTSVRNDHQLNKIGVPFSYLGFEFYGHKTLIKSQNLAKFYRRMITSIKSKCKRAKQEVKDGLVLKPIIYRRQLYRLYVSFPLNLKNTFSNKKWLEKNEWGTYMIKTKPIKKEQRSNFISYVNRASEVMNEPAIKEQIRNHKKIFNQAVQRHLNKEKRY